MWSLKSRDVLGFLKRVQRKLCIAYTRATGPSPAASGVNVLEELQWKIPIVAFGVLSDK